MATEGETAFQNGVAAAASDMEGAPPSGESLPLDMEVETPDPTQNSNPTETESLETSKRGREEEEEDVKDEEASGDGGAKRAKVEENSVEEQRLKVMTEREIGGEKEDESARQGEGEGVQGDAEGVKGEDKGEVKEGAKAKEEMEREGEEEGTEVEDQREENVKECGGSGEGALESEGVKLGPKTFGSSVEMFNYFYKFLHFWPLNVDINKYEHMIFLDLLKKGSLEAEKKMGSGVQSFQIRVHPVWKSRCFFVMRTDDSFDDFSYRKSIDNILPLPENMKVPAKADVDKALAGKKPAAHRQGGGGGKGNHGRGRGRNRR
ncbi:DNA-directed RNA polymerase V subunit 1 [Nymphaea thermarum]|nr:DNA-directed RNA polymerase V subunit 1 [Nymphaea thermarum]